MNTTALIKKLIEISDIKKTYLIDTIDILKKELKIMTQNEEKIPNEILTDKFKIEERIFSLDLEFVNTLDDIKKSEGINSIIELDRFKFPCLYDLKIIVSEICKYEEKIEDLQLEVKNKKIERLEDKKIATKCHTLKTVSSIYKKNKSF